MNDWERSSGTVCQVAGQYVFLSSDEHRIIYAHRDALLDGLSERVHIGLTVTFDLAADIPGARSPVARNVRVAHG